MQVLALFIDVLIAPPSNTAASAMVEPTMARIKAYSAADAPLSSNANVLTNFNMKKFLLHFR